MMIGMNMNRWYKIAKIDDATPKKLDHRQPEDSENLLI